MKVLVIDEEMQVQRLVQALENRHPKDKFVLVHNLADGREAIWEERYDILVVDIMLPADEVSVPGSSDEGGIVAGLMLIDLIRADKACVNHSTPVVLLTGVAARIHPRVAEAQGQYEERFVQKPVKPDILYERLERVLRKESN